jgi:hypothetical protein
MLVNLMTSKRSNETQQHAQKDLPGTEASLRSKFSAAAAAEAICHLAGLSKASWPLRVLILRLHLLNML